MRRLIINFSFLFLISYTLFAQQTIQGEKKVYRDEDNKLYINKDLGIYLWISTSPDPGSEKIRLMSDSSKKYTNPMYLDTEGYNTVRSPSAVDTTTKQTIFPLQDIIFEVYRDGIPPETKAIYSSEYTKILNGEKFFGGNLKIKLSSFDATSGIESLKYSLNNGSFSDYKDELTAFKEGENILEYYASDHVGNVESSKKDIFYIDNTPPKTEFMIEGDRSDKYISAKAVIKLSSSDDNSGVKGIYFRIDNGPFSTYLKPIPVSVIKSDETSISFYAEDNLGNKEAIKVIGGKENSIQVEGSSSTQNVLFEFYIDREPPKVDIQVDKNLYKGNYVFVSPTSQFTITAEDDKSGVDKIFYSVNNSSVENLYKDPFTLNKDGLYYIRVKSSDFVGNVSPLLSKIYYCDIKAPVTKLTLSNPKYFSHDTLFISTRTVLTLASSDDQSGVASTQYKLNEDEPVIYSKPFSIESPGLTTILYYATDNVNNKEANNDQRVFVDNQPPVIIYHFSVESIGSKKVRDELYTIYPINTMLYIAATDAHSGGEKIEYTINGGSLLTINPVKSFKPGNYVVQVNAYDVLGNKSTQEIKFAIEE